MNANETVAPATVGYHCSGECWHEFGSSAELIKWLTRLSPESRDWFAYGEWATDENLATHALPAMSTVHPTQDFLVLDTVEHYRRGDSPQAASAKKFYETHPTLFKWMGHYFIFQGTHRLTSLYLDGATEFTGWVLDLDELA